MSLKPWATPGEIAKTLPRAAASDVQVVVDKWKRMNKIDGPADDRVRGEFRAWCYRTVNHFFAPLDVFDVRSWSLEDARVCLAALEKT